MKNNKIELLSPAKNALIGIEAVKHGADAVYIGMERFGARYAASNSIEDLEKLTSFAHLYNAKVYITLNTILKDNELEQAQKMVYQAYNIGADALIVQDMALLQLDLPPIPLHASTQCNNRTLEQVKFLQDVGFEQVVLARELSLKQIEQIARSTDVALETFVYGALCVSYSGQCYMSEYAKGRSANRGECAQMCRLPYSLYDMAGEEILKDKHILSLKDFNAQAYLKELIDIGVSSFKIEGRLKDEVYVKNVTAHFRTLIDNILEGSDRVKSSSGRCKYSFVPNLDKSFSRSTTTYFLNPPIEKMATISSAKSLGEYVGEVAKVGRSSFLLGGTTQINNGDGVCVIAQDGDFVGMRINRVEGRQLYPFKMVPLKVGDKIYRNSDTQFVNLLSKPSATRKVSINKIDVKYIDNQFVVSLLDEDNISSQTAIEYLAQQSNKPEKMVLSWQNQLTSLGDTIYELDVKNIELNGVEQYFLPISVITSLRRQVVDNHTQMRLKQFTNKGKMNVSYPQYHTKRLDYRANVYNEKAAQFYQNCGAEVGEMAYEKTHRAGAELMRTKYCIRRELGICQKGKAQPLMLVNGANRFRVEFDCECCEMKIITDK